MLQDIVFKTVTNMESNLENTADLISRMDDTVTGAVYTARTFNYQA